MERERVDVVAGVVSGNRYRIVITIEDREDGSVQVICTPNVATMIEASARGPMAKSAAVAYAMGMARHAVDTSKLLQNAEQRTLIPPNISTAIASQLGKLRGK